MLQIKARADKLLQVYRLTEALEQSQLEASLAKQQQQTTDAQLAKASTSAALLETELRKLQHDHEALSQQMTSLTTGKASAKRAAALGETRAATAEALLSSKTQELEQLQVHYKRLLSEQQAELERVRQQLHIQSTDHSKAASAAATREQSLLQEVQAANSIMVELKTSLAAERSSGELLQAKVTELTAELEAARQGKQQLAASLKQVCGFDPVRSWGWHARAHAGSCCCTLLYAVLQPQHTQA
jgi:chromosome segregation ATPase